MSVIPAAYQGDGSAESDVIVPELISQPGITLEALQELAMENNPSIKQVSASASRAAGIQEQVGLKPNPRIGYFADEIGDNSSAGLHGAFISQTFITGDKLAANRHVIGHDIESMMWQVETQRVRVLTDIRVRFFKALAAQRRMKLAREFRVVAVKGLSVAKDRLEAEGTRPDVLQSEIQVSEVDLLIKRAEFEFAAVWKELVAIAGVPDMAPTTLVGELEMPRGSHDLESVYDQIVEESPLLQAAYQQVHRAQANFQRQRVQSRPNLTGQLGVGYDDSTGDEFVNVQISIPLPVHNANQGNIRAAHAAYVEATQNVQRIKMQIRKDLARVMREYEVAKATVTLYNLTILPKAKESQQLITAAHTAGEFDFLRVLTARKIFFDVNLQYVTALSDLATTNAQIEGLLLSGGLSNVASYSGDDSLRGQALSGQ
ncbi:MAG: TolC family protein [Planctomycetes bacterium]|nr:TolC family protein [Planctomycetota bacterium]